MISESPKKILLNKKYISLQMDSESTNTPATPYSNSELLFDMTELDDFIELTLTS